MDALGAAWDALLPGGDELLGEADLLRALGLPLSHADFASPTAVGGAAMCCAACLAAAAARRRGR